MGKIELAGGIQQLHDGEIDIVSEKGGGKETKQELVKTLTGKGKLTQVQQNQRFRELMDFLRNRKDIQLGKLESGEHVIAIGETIFVLDDIKTEEKGVMIEYEGQKYYNIKWLKEKYENELPSYQEWEAVKKNVGGIDTLLSLTHGGEPGFMTKEGVLHAGGYSFQAAQGEDVFGQHIANWSGVKYSGYVPIRNDNYIGCKRIYRGKKEDIEWKRVTPEEVIGYIEKGAYIGLWYRTENYVEQVNKELYAAYKNSLRDDIKINIQIENSELEQEMIKNMIVLVMSKYSPVDTKVGELMKEVEKYCIGMGIEKEKVQKHFWGMCKTLYKSISTPKPRLIDYETTNSLGISSNKTFDLKKQGENDRTVKRTKKISEFSDYLLTHKEKENYSIRQYNLIEVAFTIYQLMYQFPGGSQKEKLLIDDYSIDMHALEGDKLGIDDIIFLENNSGGNNPYQGVSKRMDTGEIAIQCADGTYIVNEDKVGKVVQSLEYHPKDKIKDIIDTMNEYKNTSIPSWRFKKRKENTYLRKIEYQKLRMKVKEKQDYVSLSKNPVKFTFENKLTNYLPCFFAHNITPEQIIFWYKAQDGMGVNAYRLMDNDIEYVKTVQKVNDGIVVNKFDWMHDAGYAIKDILKAYISLLRSNYKEIFSYCHPLEILANPFEGEKTLFMYLRTNIARSEGKRREYLRTLLNEGIIDLILFFKYVDKYKVADNPICTFNYGSNLALESGYTYEQITLAQHKAGCAWGDMMNWWESVSMRDMEKTRNHSKEVEKNDKVLLLREEYLKYAPKAAKEYFETLDDDTKDKVKEIVEYTQDSINFTVIIDGKQMIVPFEKENLKHADVGKGINKKVQTEIVKVHGESIKETYFEWNYLNKEYLEKGTEQQGCTQTSIGIIPQASIYESIMKAMPANDYTKKMGCIAGKQVYGLLGGMLSGYSSCGSPDLMGFYGYLWSASARNTDDAWAVRSVSAGGELGFYLRNSLFPVRALRTLPYEAFDNLTLGEKAKKSTDK